MVMGAVSAYTVIGCSIMLLQLLLPGDFSCWPLLLLGVPSVRML
jgi:hypothetical protein